MKTILSAAMIGIATFVISAWAEDVPCEDMLKNLRAAESDAKLSDADAAKLKELEDKGIERCNADDDMHADEFFTKAMAILGK